jgi:hypothetical protein
MTRLWPVALALTLAPCSVPAQESLPQPLATRLEAARAECEGFEGGTLHVGDTTLSRPDLNGDGVPDWVLDETGLSCSSAVSLFCGTGGCMVSFLVGDIVTERLSKGWQVVAFGQMQVLLIRVHGSLCDGINPTPCVEAMVWDSAQHRFSTIAPQPSP